jgi:hypothetical protein
MPSPDAQAVLHFLAIVHRLADVDGFVYHRSRLIPEYLPCQRCRYLLRGVTSATCPECGEPIPGPQRRFIAAERDV